MLNSFNASQQGASDVHVQSLECLRIMLCHRKKCSRNDLLGAKQLRSQADVKNAKRQLLRTIHPDKVSEAWARPICQQATEIINSL